MGAICKIPCLLLLACCPFFAHAQEIFHYGDKRVDQQEFVRAYLKNNNDPQVSEKSIRDYLQLFIRFKLKVAEAYSQRLDTLANQRAELLEFRRQAAESHLNDEETLRALMGEAFVRSQVDIEAAMILVHYGKDTARSRRQAYTALKELQSRAPFATVAKKYSTDSASRARGGSLGYVTVFGLPYALENALYPLAPGAFSEPIPMGKGFVILMKKSSRKALGARRVRQLLVTLPSNAPEASVAAARQQADSMYRAIMRGVPFEQVAHDFWSPALASGELPEMLVGSADPAFESAVYALQEDGDWTAPFRTSLGVHLVQRIQTRPVNTDEGNEAAMEALKQQLIADPRMNQSKEKLLARIHRAVTVKATTIDRERLWRFADSALGTGSARPGGITPATVLYTVGGSAFTVEDWLTSMRAQYRNAMPPRDRYPLLLKEFRDAVATGYYRDHLETYDTAFAAQVNEFREGNLLFEVMQRAVWEKAAADSQALRKYYDAHRNKYQWQPGAAAVVFTAADSATAGFVFTQLQANPANWQQVVASTGGRVQADSGRFEMAQLSMAGAVSPIAGKLYAPIAVSGSEGYIFCYVTRLINTTSPRSFDDARGFVTNDYQVQLEEAWINRLMAKYPIRINEPVVKAVVTRLVK